MRPASPKPPPDRPLPLAAGVPPDASLPPLFDGSLLPRREHRARGHIPSNVAMAPARCRLACDLPEDRLPPPRWRIQLMFLARRSTKDRSDDRCRFIQPISGL